ncbi:MAG: endonuclease/exonuclease/phosphatase family protein, partial [Bacteroidota bacterium]|nr:endonuclease/exonuclease/phosphatase family protein [Bacteroidota bacterium]
MKIEREEQYGWIVGTLVLSIGTILAFAPDAWLTMMARAFMLQWTFAFALLALILVWQRRYMHIGLCSLACMLMSAVQLEPSGIPSDPINDVAGLRVLHMNVLQPNSDHGQIISRALASKADVISVQEVDEVWAKVLREDLAVQYPYQLIETRSNCYGIALFSKLPFQSVELIELHGSPFIEVIMDVNGRPIRLITAHATSPISYRHFQRRNAQLRELADHIAGNDITTVVIGDLNSVHWDRAHRQFRLRSGLKVVNDPD